MPRQSHHGPFEEPPEGQGFEQEPMEFESPRRAASARFVVESEVGSEAAIREAMDPANQSLAEALRLSYRVLQVVILVLVVLFIFSGWKQVQDDQTGVLAVWGDIVEVDGERALAPGLQFSKWPYPAGEFILLKESNRPVALGNVFWPLIRPNQTFEEAVSQATVHERLKPGRDGSLITSGGDLAHAEVTASYQIEDPVAFVTHLPDPEADRVVRLLVQRSVVHAAASATLEEIIDQSGVLASEIQAAAQEALNAAGVGIRLESLALPRVSAPLVIRKTLEEVQRSIIARDELLEQARKDATAILTAVVGSRAQSLIHLINEYEEALQSGDQTQVEERLRLVSERLDAEDTGGEASNIIGRARAYASDVDSTLGRDARYFQSLLPLFRKNPQMLVRQLWFETYARVLQQRDAEVYFVPGNIENVQLDLSSLDFIQRIRVNRQLDRDKASTARSLIDPFASSFRRVTDMTPEGSAGRILDVDAAGRVQPGAKP
jgi:membrane protease subunit HflK